MKDGTEKLQFPIKNIFIIVALMLVIAYIFYHFYNGKYGFKNYLNKQSIIDKKNIEAKNLETEINVMKNKIELLQDDNLDSDLLDEEIKKNTAYIKKNEIVIYSDEFMKE